MDLLQVLTVIQCVITLVLSGGGSSDKSGSSSSSGSNYYEDKLCKKLKDYIEIAEEETDFDQNFFLNEHNYTHDFIYSDVFLKLSKYASQLILKGDSGQFLNLNPELRQYSKCIEKYLNSVCTPTNKIKCPGRQKYREEDGICNNLKSAKDGASGTAYSSLNYHYYDDGIMDVRRSIKKPYDLPNPRVLSNLFFNDCKNEDVTFNEGPSMAGVMYGQFVCHDNSMGADTTFFESGSHDCCKPDLSGPLPKDERSYQCVPISVPKDDPFFKAANKFCFNMERLKFVYDNDCVLSSRKPINLQTSVLDLSMIYGPTESESRKVRTFQGGQIYDNAKRNFYSFDIRAGQNPMLAVTHSVVIHAHNRFAQGIAGAKPEWSDEHIYQQARRITIAAYQFLVFNEWLPVLFDKKYIKFHFSKKCERDSLATSVAFAHAAFRHQHTHLPQSFQLYDENFEMNMDIPLSDILFRVDLLDDHYVDLLRGMIVQKPNFNGCHSEIRNYAFKNASGAGIDLIAVDIQRGRETGVQPYIWYAQICLKKKIHNFDDLAPHISKSNIAKLRKVYRSVHDIDLYIGAKLEKTPKPYVFGPTLSCIIGDQFARYKYCDKFFYDNPNNPYPFTPVQLEQLKNVSFAQIVCDETDITRVPLKPFSLGSEIVDCSDVPKFLMSL